MQVEKVWREGVEEGSIRVKKKNRVHIIIIINHHHTTRTSLSIYIYKNPEKKRGGGGDRTRGATWVETKRIGRARRPGRKKREEKKEMVEGGDGSAERDPERTDDLGEDDLAA
jgi:hypothetical protein